MVSFLFSHTVWGTKISLLFSSYNKMVFHYYSGLWCVWARLYLWMWSLLLFDCIYFNHWLANFFLEKIRQPMFRLCGSHTIFLAYSSYVCYNQLMMWKTFLDSRVCRNRLRIRFGPWASLLTSIFNRIFSLLSLDLVSRISSHPPLPTSIRA